MSPERPSIEAAFAANLKALRAARSITQAQLAEKMYMRGFKWHPATVYKIENDERQIQLAEAVEVARILDTSIEDMTRESQGKELIALRSEHEFIRNSLRWLQRNLNSYWGQREYFANQLDEADEARALLPPDELEQMTKVAHPGDQLLGPVRKVYEALKELYGPEA